MNSEENGSRGSSIQATLDHKRMNVLLMSEVLKDLIDRMNVHDNAKMEDPELEFFDKYTPKLATSTYGSDEYKSYLEGLKPALDHHYARYRHHPEFGNFNNLSTEEVWEDIPGYKNVYRISNYGRIKSLNSNIIMKHHITPKGYYRLQLSLNGSYKNKLVHRLVAESFLINSDNKDQVNHKDGNKLNNYFDNLEWVNNSENQIHAYSNDLQEIKYVVHCEELNLTTFGTGEMVRKLKELGYSEVRDSGILACIYETTNTHMNLHFTGTNYEVEPKLKSPCSWMNILDVVEMFVDWKAATLRHNDGNILISIVKNKERFKLDEVTLFDILQNSIEIFEDHNNS